MMAFRVGQKVVRVGSCRRADISISDARRMGYSCPEIGEIVTIKTLNEWPKGTILTFHEHDNSHVQRQLNSLLEPGFAAEAFRPIVERKTDIAIFEAMLNPSLEDVANLILQEVTLCP